MFSSDIPRNAADFTSITPQVLDLTPSQSDLHGENAVIFAAEAIHTVSICRSLVPITAGWTEAVWIQLAQGFTRHQRLGNRTPEPLISGPTPKPLGHELHM